MISCAEGLVKTYQSKAVTFANVLHLENVPVGNYFLHYNLLEALYCKTYNIDPCYE